MSNFSPHKSSAHVIFFGMQGSYSFSILRALLASTVEICAVVLPSNAAPGKDIPLVQRKASRATRASLPLLGPNAHTSMIEVAKQHQIPVWEVYRLAHPETIATLKAYHPENICVACFPVRIPLAIIDLPRLGCLNVHPSLLPANRGPVPLFWTFREGLRETGVTVHLLTEKMDSGAILAQEAIAVPDGISYTQLETQCAALGGKLLVRALTDLFTGRSNPYSQDEAKSSYHTFPTDDDFIVPAEVWSAQHVYNFIRGIHSWQQPITITIAGKRIPILTATSYSRQATNNTQKLTLHNENEATILCKDGTVRVTLAIK